MEVLTRPEHVQYFAPLVKFIRENGLDHASLMGLAEDHCLYRPDPNQIGILKGPKYKRCLWGLFKRRNRRYFIATLWLVNEARGASNERWVLEVHGDQYFELVKSLGEKIEKEFGVNIQLRHGTYGESDKMEALYGDEYY